METTKEKHAQTPGPWVVKYDKNGLPFIGVASDPWTYPGTVATVEQEKDARLIAAAPEMLEQCKLFEKVLKAIGDMGYRDEIEGLDLVKWLMRTTELREVLAKVEGGEG